MEPEIRHFEIGTCENCRAERVTVSSYTEHRGKRLCDLCVRTMGIGIHATICYVGNKILAEGVAFLNTPMPDSGWAAALWGEVHKDTAEEDKPRDEKGVKVGIGGRMVVASAETDDAEDAKDTSGIEHEGDLA